MNASPDSADIETLRTTIYDIDGLSQEGFSAIQAITRIILKVLETPDGYRCLHSGYIATALEVIAGKAEDIVSCIGNEARQVGCACNNEAESRRYVARLAHTEQGGVQ